MKNELRIELLEALRNKSSEIQKLAYLYITALSGFVIALGLSKEDMVSILLEVKVFVFAFLVIITIDALINLFLFKAWIQAKSKIKLEEIPVQILEKLVFFQPIIHLFFITMIFTYHIGLFSGMHDFQKDYKIMSQIQIKIENYKSHNGEYPESLDKLENTSYSIKYYQNQLRNHLFKYIRLDKSNYKIIFDTGNGKISEDEDFVVTNQYLLNNLTEK